MNATLRCWRLAAISADLALSLSCLANSVGDRPLDPPPTTAVGGGGGGVESSEDLHERVLTVEAPKNTTTDHTRPLGSPRTLLLRCRLA